MIRNRAAAVMLACAALAACAEPATLPDIVARFTLEPPAVLQNEVVRIEILSETLVLFDDDTARRTYRQRMDYVDPAGRDTTLEYQSDYTYRIEGFGITFASVCNDTASCAPPPHLWGQRTGGGLELRSHFDPDAVLRYRQELLPDH
jgi:hypothetical protein